MHRGHRHDNAIFDNGPAMTPGAGHNHAQPLCQPAQWQLLHGDAQPAPSASRPETDLDLVTAAFVQAFVTSSDPTSFLRLAKVPFEATADDGAKLALLRVEIDDVTDVGSITPHLGGASFRYDPLPGRMTSRRKRVRFIYFDGERLRPLDLVEATKLRT